MEALYIIVMGIIGMIMLVAPQKLAKESVLKNPSMLRLVRIMGAIAVIGSVFALVLMFA